MPVLFRKGSKNRIVTLTGLVLLAMGILSAITIFLLRFDSLWIWYDYTVEKLAVLETKILDIQYRGLFVGCILCLFAIKAVFPIYPTSTVCFLTGLVLPVYLAIPVNIVGFCVMLTAKYFWGFAFGGGYAWKIISRYEGARKLIQQDGKGNPLLLVGLRIVPMVPVNSVSTIYGSMNFGYGKFLVLSVLGFLPRLISFTAVGRNAFDPLSVGFLLPLTLLCIFTGVSMLSVNGGIVIIQKIIEKYGRKKSAKENAEESESAETSSEKSTSNQTITEEIVTNDGLSQ